MLYVYICEDDQGQLTRTTECVQKYISIHNLSVKVACSSVSPNEVINHRKQNKVAGLYFLDVDLGNDMTGLQLAEEIRKIDPRGFIVFITSDADSLMLTFKYKIEAMDYIVKGSQDQNKRIRECIKNAYEKYMTRKTSPLQSNFVFKLSLEYADYEDGDIKLYKNDRVCIEYSKILYFESKPHADNVVIIYTENSRYEFRSRLGYVERDVDKNNFHRCHRSYIVNLNKIAALSGAPSYEIRLINGEIIYVASDRLTEMQEKLRTLKAV